MKREKMIFLSIFISLVISTQSTETHYGFYVEGQNLYKSNGELFVMRGINVAHSWFKDKTIASLEAVAAAGANTVRIVLSNGQVWKKDSLEDVNKIIQACKERQLTAVLEVHDATGSDSIDDLNHTVDYWLEIKDALINNEKYVILNVANEWFGSWKSTDWKNGYIQALPKLRAAGIKNTIMVDAAGWGQYAQSISDFGTTILQADAIKNTVFSIHMYEYAGGNAETVEQIINNVLNKNLALVIGEFGSKHTHGDVDEESIMCYSQAKNVGYLGWSWKGNNADLYYLDIANTFDGVSYTPWGTTLVYHQCGIKATVNKPSAFWDKYIQYFYGNNAASSWGQAVSVMTAKHGGPIHIWDIRRNGYFYVEYSGNQHSIELCLQSWSGGEGWTRISPSEIGVTNNVNYAKFSYDSIPRAYSLNLLDQVHVGAKETGITVFKLQYALNS